MSNHQVAVLMADLALIVVLARLFGRVAERCGQPAVVGEITVGILAGPTVLDGAVSDVIFPAEVRPYLQVFAAIGVVVFMFGAGLELDRGLLNNGRRLVLTVSLFAYSLPFLLGCALAVVLLARHETVSEIGFVLFLGAAISVTAFPVLARILHDNGMLKGKLGQLGLACSAIDDLVAWCVLAIVIGIVQARIDDQWRLLLLVPLIAGLRFLVRPLLMRLPTDRAGGSLLAAVAGSLACGAMTEWIGLHYIFGAFLFGVAFPRTRPVDMNGVRAVSVLFLPAFFVVSGMRVDLDAIGGWGLAELAAIIAVAVAGKLLGTYLGARMMRMTKRDSSALAALMNARGLTEIVILTVGLELQVIDQPLYSLMVVMALVTTSMTAPLLKLTGVTSRAQHAAAEPVHSEPIKEPT
ncbi:glutathione-regulated potassium-efflux system protein KefB [Mycobacterium basiliense]|uniref:Glutathione-regulated potassium-efflux system protein KefB n=1 Tax=Mycobacterium basiliense TaxID=2094119 RepID=A0A3S4BH21_9MYCO|nr:cation:proton antiporter [Mycobacterium basiliense]VDM88085.1 glutathione-regulated potassium-efflux system protein KefB [Mycobacterium basiliense]